MHRRFARRSFRTSSLRRKTTWARTTHNDVGPGVLNGYDLLATWQADQGILLLPAGLTVARLVGSIAITYTETAVAANNGALIAIGTADKSDITGGGGTVSSPVVQQYDLDYMWWEQLYTAEQLQYSGVVTNLALFRRLDIRSRRKLRGQGETLTLQIVPTGNVTLTQVSFTTQALVMLPR